LTVPVPRTGGKSTRYRRRSQFELARCGTVSWTELWMF
jgi:hypothetical protein